MTATATLRTPLHYYRLMTVEQAQCRGTRLHTFEQPDPRADRLPKGFRVISHEAGGMYHIAETCQNGCGKIRHGWYKWRNRKFVLASRRWYEQGDDWIKVPQEVKLTPTMIRLMLMGDCSALIIAAGNALNGSAKE